MSSTTNFISELVRAASNAEKLGDYEKRRLLERSVTMIRDMRESIGIPQNRSVKDEVFDLQTISAAMSFGQASFAQESKALLAAAGTIRDLHIVLDTKTEIRFEQK